MKKLITKALKFKNNLTKSKEGRTLISNFGYLTLLQVAGYIFPLITIPYLARVIGVDSFGKIAFAAAIIVWFQAISDWGFNYTATRDVARCRENLNEVSTIFSNVLWARCFLMIMSLGILLPAIYFIPTLHDNKAIILITFLIIPGYIMFPEWFFQAMEKMKYITIFNVLSKLLFTLAVFVFIREKSDFILQPLLSSLGFMISGIIAMYIILIKWKVKLRPPNIPSIYETIKNSTDVFINNIVPNLYNSFSTILLGFYGGSISNGILDAGTKFVSVFQQFMTIIARTFFPYLSRRIEKHQLYVNLNVYLSLFLSLFLFLFAPLLIKLFYTAEFYNAILILRIMAISVFLIAVRNAYGTHYMIIQGYEKQLRNLIFVGSFIGFLLSFPLIYLYDYIGAAFNIVIAQLIMTVLVVRKAKQIKNNIFSI